MSIYLRIFLCYLQIGLFSIGGGHAAIPVVQSMVVEKNGWMTMEEFMDMVTIAEMTPGPFALNSATFIGIKMGGVFGGLIASIAFLIPGFILVILLALIIRRFSKVRAVEGALEGIRPATTGLIWSSMLTLTMLAVFSVTSFAAVTAVDWIAVVIFVAVFAAMRFKKLNPIIGILGGGVLGVILYSIF